MILSESRGCWMSGIEHQLRASPECREQESQNAGAHKEEDDKVAQSPGKAQFPVEGAAYARG